MEDSSEDIELLSCWPPPDVTCNNGDREQTGSSSQRDGEMKEHPPTGRTTDTSKRQQEDVPHKTVKKVKSILAPPGVCEHLADVALARWWRRTGRDLCSSRNLAQDVSPHTLLAQIIRYSSLIIGSVCMRGGMGLGLVCCDEAMELEMKVADSKP